MEQQVQGLPRLVLPAEVAARYGLRPGETAALTTETGGLTVRRAASSLAKLYIEPTSLCNLDCRTCVRNSWDEPQGMMSAAVFDRIIDGLASFQPAPSVFFGGLFQETHHQADIRAVIHSDVYVEP